MKRWIVIGMLAMALTDVELFKTDDGTLAVLTSSDPQADYAVIELWYKEKNVRLSAGPDLVSAPIELTLRKELIVPAVLNAGVAANPVPLDIDKIFRVTVRYLKTTSVK